MIILVLFLIFLLVLLRVDSVLLCQWILSQNIRTRRDTSIADSCYRCRALACFWMFEFQKWFPRSATLSVSTIFRLALAPGIFWNFDNNTAANYRAAVFSTYPNNSNRSIRTCNKTRISLDRPQLQGHLITLFVYVCVHSDTNNSFQSQNDFLQANSKLNIQKIHTNQEKNMKI